MYKIDLHTHSIASPDGALTAQDYRQLLTRGLDVIAVTDHETIAFAIKLQRELGDQIIVGEEIKTTEGEIIGLYLKNRIPSQLTPEATMQQIHEQGGLVYIPHPFETVRSGMRTAALDRTAQAVDIIEVFNGRAYFQNKAAAANQWAEDHTAARAAASDAHGRAGWGRTYTLVNELPTRDNLVSLLDGGQCVSRRVGLRGICYPKLNRLRKKFGYAQ